jgi:hypothetical protein
VLKPIRIRGFAPIGILEKWFLGYWRVGLMAIIVLTIKLKMDNFLNKTQ